MTRLPKKVSLSEQVLFQTVNNEAVFYHLERELYYTINEAGGRIWELIAEHGSPERVVELMVSEFAVDETQLRADLANLIDQWLHAGMVVVEEDE
jgi:hypothetical protein